MDSMEKQSEGAKTGHSEDGTSPAGQKKSTIRSATPYDDAWRTLTVSTSHLLIPMVNHAFGEHFSNQATVVLSPNEHLYTSPDGKSEKRISDSNFSILDENPAHGLLGDSFDIVEGLIRKHYLLECESKPVSGKILVRIVEYAIKTGIDEEAAADSETIVISIPQAAILSLDSTKNTPDKLRMVVKTEEGQIGSNIPVLKMSDFSVDDIFSKKLYLLIPFLLFNYRKHFDEIQSDETKYHKLLEEFRLVFQRVDALVPSNEDEFSFIDVFTSKALRAVTHTVVNGLAEKYPKIREGVNSAVGGTIIEFDALRIKREGIREGIQKGRAEGVTEGRKVTAEEMIRDGLPGNMIAKYSHLGRKDIDLIAAGLNRTVAWDGAGA